MYYFTILKPKEKFILTKICKISKQDNNTWVCSFGFASTVELDFIMIILKNTGFLACILSQALIPWGEEVKGERMMIVGKRKEGSVIE